MEAGVTAVVVKAEKRAEVEMVAMTAAHSSRSPSRAGGSCTRCPPPKRRQTARAPSTVCIAELLPAT